MYSAILDVKAASWFSRRAHAPLVRGSSDSDTLRASAFGVRLWW